MDRARLKTLLYVDDETDIREVVKMALELEDRLAVQTCSCGEHALALLPDLKPDLVLLDVMMPGMDGPTTLQRMREIPTLTKIPLVFMTAKALPAEIAGLKQIGAVGVIAKPFNPMELARQVLTLWESLPNE